MIILKVNLSFYLKISASFRHPLFTILILQMFVFNHPVPFGIFFIWYPHYELIFLFFFFFFWHVLEEAAWDGTSKSLLTSKERIIYIIPCLHARSNTVFMQSLISQQPFHQLTTFYLPCDTEILCIHTDPSYIITSQVWHGSHASSLPIFLHSSALMFFGLQFSKAPKAWKLVK